MSLYLWFCEAAKEEGIVVDKKKVEGLLASDTGINLFTFSHMHDLFTSDFWRAFGVSNPQQRLRLDRRRTAFLSAKVATTTKAANADMSAVQGGIEDTKGGGDVDVGAYDDEGAQNNSNDTGDDDDAKEPGAAQKNPALTWTQQQVIQWIAGECFPVNKKEISDGQIDGFQLQFIRNVFDATMLLDIAIQNSDDEVKKLAQGARLLKNIDILLKRHDKDSGETKLF